MSEQYMTRKPQTPMTQIIKTGDPLSKFHREILGEAARIHVPLRDQMDLRRIALHLNQLARKLDALSRDRKEKEFSVLHAARFEIKLADKLIRSHKGLGTDDAGD